MKKFGYVPSISQIHIRVESEFVSAILVMVKLLLSEVDFFAIFLLWEAVIF
jgi:hypothetical protein